MSHNLNSLSPGRRLAWRLVQLVVWLLGSTIVVLLVAAPDAGLFALWNILIPVAPALLVFAPGLWRNVCPLATTALAARHGGLSAQRKLSPTARAWLNLLGVLALLVLVWLRRVGLNTSAAATLAVLLGLAALAVLMGLVFEWKSGWCSGLCPVYGVEKLYGSRPAVSLSNAHCDSCVHCSGPCPDSTKGMHPLLGPRGRTQRIAETLLVGGFPGFVWGWFNVPDGVFGNVGVQDLLATYHTPWTALAVTLVLFVLLRRWLPRSREASLVRLFAAATVACYYWYRLPQLLGLGASAEGHMLLDLHAALSAWWVIVLRVLTTGLFFWWLVLRRPSAQSWLQRPPFATVRERTEPMPLVRVQLVRPPSWPLHDSCLAGHTDSRMAAHLEDAAGKREPEKGTLCAVQRRRSSVGAMPTRQGVAPAGSKESSDAGNDTTEASPGKDCSSECH